MSIVLKYIGNRQALESELKSFIEHLHQEASLGNWLAQLEPLRDGIFELSRNPLRVWGEFDKSMNC